ncbi:MAG TPA: tetratricopeptide repeat protein [Polyangiales bacterium]|nr:tetratricopeptide repeat protein [Polyangiales bacterium]
MVGSLAASQQLGSNLKDLVAVNRTKVLEAAQKFLSKGQYDKAVVEYQKLVQEDPRDVRTLLKIGDLHTRRSKPKDAIDVYQKVADLYAKQGFFLKAVAVYKQILKLEPSHLESTQKLAKMYEELALTSEALSTYELVADAYLGQGQVPKALETMERMIEIDGQNVAVRIKFAEALSKANKPREAAQAFAAGAGLLKEQGRMDDYLRVVERQLYHDPENVEIARELSGLYLERSDPKRALAKLQICFKADPRDVQTLEMLAEAFRQLGQVAKTVSVLKEIARLHGEAGSDEGRRRTLRRVLELDPADAEAKQALSAPPSASKQLDPRPTAAPPPRRAPGPPAPPPVAVRGAPPPPQPPPEEEELDLVEESEPSGADVMIVDESSASAREPLEDPVLALLSEADAREGAGDYEGAVSALQGVLEIDANHVSAHERLKDIYLAADRRVDAVKELLWLSSAFEDQSLDRALHFAEAAYELAPKSEATRRRLRVLGAPIPGEGSVAKAPPARARYDSADQELDAMLPPVKGEDARVSLLDLPIEDDFGVPPPRRAPRVSPEQAALWLAQETSPEDFSKRPSVPAELVAEGPPSRDFAPVGTQEISPSDAPSTVAGLPVSEPPSELSVAESLPAAADAPPDEPSYLGPPPTATHEYTLDNDKFGRKAASAPVAEARSSLPESGAHAVSSAAPLSAEIEEVLDEAEFFASQGMFDEALELVQEAILIYPKSAELKQRLHDYETRADQKEAEPAESASGDDDSFDIAEKLAGELVETPEAAAEEMIDVESVFAQFKKGVAEQIAPDDSETHFDLGIAYKEMGLIDDAVNEFELAARSKKRASTALTMIGSCHLERGKSELAIEYFQKALKSEGAGIPEELALNYEIGNAYDQTGDIERALTSFEIVAARDRNYRGVSGRIDQLKKRAKPTARAR